tara:strand:+ start:1673 stop:2605 length:933 start_codon:yes stop_codon:yes gene_type:complete
MALGLNHVTNTTAAKFIPEIWSDEIVAAYEKNLVLANLVNRMPMTGKKGDTIHIPKPQRGLATAKAASTQVTLIAATEEEVQVAISNHYEYSRLIEDITDVQALSSLRQFYTSDAGYALATQVDTDLFDLTLELSNTGGDGATAADSWYQVGTGGALENYVDNTDAKVDIAGSDVFDALFRNMIQELDDNDVPMDQRALVVPPSVRNVMLGIDRYNSSDYTSQNGVQNGLIGNLYGVDVYVSTNCKDHDGSSKDGTVMLLLQKDAFVFAEQMGVRTQTQYKQEYLGDLFTADSLYGVKALRPENAVAVLI